MTAHLEKVLRHAEKKLIKAVEIGGKDSLDTYRDFLKLEEHRLYLAHRAGESGLNFANKRAATIDVVLRHIWQTALQSITNGHSELLKHDSISLLAVGGFGRQELCPYSDVDLLFLCDESLRSLKNSGILKNIIEKILYVLWDVGFKVGHASRTLDEVVEEANADLRTKTALLESRLIVGSENLYTELQRLFQKKCIESKEEEYIAWRIKDQTDRHRKHGNTVHVQEPHLKNGCGGLRDYQNLLWVAKVRKDIHSTSSLQAAGWLTRAERKKIDQAYDFTLRIRNEIHYQQKRADDLLTLKMQGQVANAFHYPQKNILRRTEAFMRDYYQPARDIFQITNLLTRRLANAPQEEKNQFWSFLNLQIQKEKSEKIDGFILQKQELYVESRNAISEPQKIIRAFQIMQQYNAFLSADLETFIRARVNTITPRALWAPKIQEILIDILKKKGKVGRIVRAMHEVGFLGKLIPEFEPLTCLVQHEFFHAYTADEHTLVCLEQLDKIVDSTDAPFSKYRFLFLECHHPEILYTTLILHDVGKVKNSPHHNEISAQLAARFAKRMRLNSHEMQTLLFLVYHHATLSEFAQRRNLEEPETIREFARIVQTQERLDMLMLVTFADAQGTTGASTNWSGWKELLVWNLYFQTRGMLQGEKEFLKKREQARKETLENVRRLISKRIIPGETTLQFDLLPKSYLNCTSEAIMARHIELVHDFLERATANENALKPIIEWIDRSNTGHSEVIIITWDRERLFSTIAGAFALAELNILSADVFTREDNIVLDTFRVCTGRHEAATNPIDRRCFEETLTRSLMDSTFDLKRELTKKRADYASPLGDAEFPTVLRLDNDTSAKHTLLHVQTPDRIGLLFDITSCFVDFNLVIFHSRITTEKGAALDTFYLSPRDGGKIEDSKMQEKLLDVLRSVLSPGKTAA